MSEKISNIRVRIGNRFAYCKVGGLKFDESDPKSVSRVQKHFQADSDINNIIAKYKKTGILGNPSLSGRKPMYGDFSDVDFAATQRKIAMIRNAFGIMPEDIQKRFENNPDKLLEFLADDKNNEEAVKLGLKDKSCLKPVPEVAPEGPEVAPAKPEVTPPDSGVKDKADQKPT